MLLEAMYFPAETALWALISKAPATRAVQWLVGRELIMPEYDKGKHEFGVLFVAGIEHQRPGSAIASFSAALYAWLVDWNCGSRQSLGTPPVLKEARLSPGAGEDDGPAHLTLEVPLGLSDRTVDARWLLAESSWPALFTAPRFLELARWIWKVSTCLLVMQFVVPMRRHWNQAHKGPDHIVPWHGRLAHVAAALCYLVLMGNAGMLSVLLSMLLLALAVAAKLPIPQIDRAVRWTVVKISSVLGDSYVLAHCPVQFAAMRTKVAQDLRWLQRNCDRVAVVAHSQGAAIAHQVLKDGDYDHRPDGLRAFITSGQGISKMHLLQLMDWNPRYARVAWWSRALITFGLACAGLPALVLLTSHWLHAAVLRALVALPFGIPLIMIVGGLLIVALGVMRAIRALSAPVQRDLRLPAECAKFTWTDYYASADPVSNGPLINGPAGESGPRIRLDSHLVAPPSRCNEIYNSGSLLTDHNGYLGNRDQFVSKLLNNLVAAAYGRPRDTHKPQLVCRDDLIAVGKRRRRQIAYLVIARMITIGFGFALLFYYRIRAFDAPMSRLVHTIPPHARVGDSPARLMTVLLIGVVAYTAFLIPRQIWERRAARKFFGTATRYRPPAEQPDYEQSPSEETAVTVAAAAG